MNSTFMDADWQKIYTNIFPNSDSKLMFWNVFFKGTIYTQIFFAIQILNLCSEIDFLREQFIQNVWLLISLAADLYF